MNGIDFDGVNMVKRLVPVMPVPNIKNKKQKDDNKRNNEKYTDDSEDAFEVYLNNELKLDGNYFNYNNKGNYNYNNGSQIDLIASD